MSIRTVRTVTFDVDGGMRREQPDNGDSTPRGESVTLVLWNGMTAEAGSGKFVLVYREASVVGYEALRPVEQKSSIESKNAVFNELLVY